MCELCQEVFLCVYWFLYQYCGDSVLKFWVVQVVYLVVCCYLECCCIFIVDVYDDEDGQWWVEQVSDGVDVEVMVLQDEVYVLLYVVIDVLLFLQCIVLMFYYLEELFIVEIVYLIDLVEGIIKSYLFCSCVCLCILFYLYLGEFV